MLISIIVPIYNVVLERFQGCMNSLQHQTLTDIEIILVDDCGEMRESILYAQELMKTDSRIKLLTNEQNCGGGASRDKGCAAAFGEYVAFVDADDKVDLDFYEKLYGRTKDRKYDIVKGELYGDRGHLNEHIRIGLSEGKPLYEIFNCQHTSAIYRTEFIRSNNITYGRSRVSQDVTFLLKVSVLAHNIAIVDGTYYYYDRDNEHSITHTTLASNISHYCQAIQERMDFLLEHVDCNNPAFLRYMDYNTSRLTARAKMLVNANLDNDICKVSVVIPTYNAAEYLSSLIEVLTAQSLSDIEIIFVDDGSTDRSVDIIHQWMKQDSRISYYYQENAGAGAARNNGINRARGKYIICIDSDDLYDNNFLEEMYLAAEHSGADAVMCHFRRFNYWTNTLTENEGYKKEKLPLDTVFNGRNIPNFCDCFNPGPINKLYRRKFILQNELRYSCTHVANDVLFGYSAMILASKVYCLSKNLLTVRRYVNPNSISASRQKYLEESIQAVNELWTWAKKQDLLDETYLDQLLKIFVNATVYNSQYGEKEEFWRACCDFINKITMNDVSIEKVRKLFNINTEKFEKKLKELDQSTDCEKELFMLNHKINFIKKMKQHLQDINPVKTISPVNSPEQLSIGFVKAEFFGDTMVSGKDSSKTLLKKIWLTN